MSETFYGCGQMSERLPAHPLLPDGHEFEPGEMPVVTYWGDVLPPVAFSGRQLELLSEIAERPRLLDSEQVIVFARYITPKITFDEQTGCWQLPLRAEYDDKKRARYPLVTVSALGYSKMLAHRASIETFMGADITDKAVDHRCLSHACCNPYHLEAVTTGVNSLRGRIARRRAVQRDLFQIPVDERLTYAELALLAAASDL